MPNEKRSNIITDSILSQIGRRKRSPGELLFPGRYPVSTSVGSPTEGAGSTDSGEAVRAAETSVKEDIDANLTAVQEGLDALPAAEGRELEASRAQQNDRIAALNARGKYSTRDLIAEILPLVIGSVGSGVTGGKLALGQFAKNQLVRRAAETTRKFESKERRLGEIAEEGQAERLRIKASYGERGAKARTRLEEVKDARHEHLEGIANKVRTAKDKRDLMRATADTKWKYEKRRMAEEYIQELGLAEAKRALDWMLWSEQQDRLETTEERNAIRDHARDWRLWSDKQDRLESTEERKASRDHGFSTTLQNQRLLHSGIQRGNVKINETTRVIRQEYVNSSGDLIIKEMADPEQTESSLWEATRTHIDRQMATGENDYGGFFEYFTKGPEIALDQNLSAENRMLLSKIPTRQVKMTLSRKDEPYKYALRLHELSKLMYRVNARAVNVARKSNGLEPLHVNYDPNKHDHHMDSKFKGGGPITNGLPAQ